MTSLVPGISGTLMPEQYLARRVAHDIRHLEGTDEAPQRAARHLTGWWRTASARCGPASPLRVIFDALAMPLFGILGFRAHDAAFHGATCRATLTTPGGSAVALVITCWAARPSSRWADVADHAHRIGAPWGIVLAPPFLSLLPTEGHASRRSLDFELPTVLATGGAEYLLSLLRASRFDASDGAGNSVLARVVARADNYRTEVKTDLQAGVAAALTTLVPAVRGVSRSARDTAPVDQALTIVYRVLFLLFAESRRLLPVTERIYSEGYAIEQLCLKALRGATTGLWDSLAAISRLSRLGCQTMDLRVTPFNGALFARAAAPALEKRLRRSRHRDERRAADAAIANALVALASRRTPAGTERILFRDLGVEQLGAVYERVLDLPDVSPPPPQAGRGHRHSRSRRETGTFYTPQPLADFVVRRTLAPLVDGATTDDIVRLRVLDPAMGSGAFLVAACRYLATAYEQAAIAEGRCDSEDLDEQERAGIRRLIAERCLAGVDRNGTAVQLARLSLWLATLSEGRPLGFLDHRLRTGDSLVGAWPDDLRRVSQRAHTRAPLPLFGVAELSGAVHSAVEPLARVMQNRDDTVADVRNKEEAWRLFQSDASPLHRWRLASHVWCARWFSSPDDTPDAAETRALMGALLTADRTLPTPHLRRRLDHAVSTAQRLGFFHWPLEFPDVFLSDATGRAPGGFDAIVGNPPWEMLRRDPGDAEARSGALLRYVRQSGQFPSCAEGHLNLYQAFIDRTLSLVRPGGRIGLVLPWGLSTDDGSGALRRRLLQETRLDMVVGIDNAHGLFPIHRGVRMAAVTATHGGPTGSFNATFGVKDEQALDALPSRGAPADRNVRLSARDIDRVGGHAARIPDLRHGHDLPLLTSLVDRFPPLGSSNGWHVTFGRELNATDVSRDLIDDGDEQTVAVIEGKHLAPFVVDASSARRLPMPIVARRIPAARFDHPRLGYRDVSGFGNRLTLIAAVIPAHAITTHTVLVIKEGLDLEAQEFLCACLNSFVINAVVRMLMGSHITTTLAGSLPIPVWRGDAIDRTIALLVRRLARPAAPQRVMARLQGLVAHRFGLTRETFQHVLAGFPLVPSTERAAALEWYERYDRQCRGEATARSDERLLLP